MKKLTPLLILIIATSCLSTSQYKAARGMAAFQKQNYKRAVRRLEAADKAGYSAPGFHYALGLCYMYMGRYKEAAEQLEKEAARTAAVWFALGNAYYNMDDYDNAAAAYRKAASLEPDYLEAIEALAMLYPDGGVSREEALALWKKALELETRDEWITRAKHYIEKLENTQ